MKSCARDRALHFERGCDGVLRPREHRAECVADRLEDVSAARLDRRPQERVVTADRVLHRGAVPFPALSTALDVAKKEGDRARREWPGRADLSLCFHPAGCSLRPGAGPRENAAAALVLRRSQLVGQTGFEPATPRPPVWCATKLRHCPRPLLVRVPRFGGLCHFVVSRLLDLRIGSGRQRLDCRKPERQNRNVLSMGFTRVFELVLWV